LTTNTQTGSGGVRRRRNRESEVLSAALALFATKGYAATTVQDVADSIGVLKGSLYHYIDTKEDLLYMIFHEAHLENERLMTEVTALDLEPVELLRTYLSRSLRVTLANLERTTLYFRDWRHLTGDHLETLKKQRVQYDRFMRKLIRDAYEQVGIDNPVNLKYVSSFVIGGTNWVADWYTAGRGDGVEAVVNSYTELAMAAIMGSGRAG
jgi:AcrR family transcriptional regulator